MKNSQIEAIALMLAAAYWRGRLESLKADPASLEAMISAAAEHDMESWKPAARNALS